MFVVFDFITVPKPSVIVSKNHSDMETVLTLTCTVTLDTNVDSGESVEMTWSGPRNIPRERDFVTEASGSGESYTGSLTISPLVEGKDDGQYMCSVTVSGGNYVLEANGSDNVNFTVIPAQSKSFLTTVLPFIWCTTKS